MVTSSCSCSGSDCLSLTVGEFHLERYATRHFNVCTSICTTGVRDALDSRLTCVFNGCLMVPVSSSNYTNSMKAFSRRDASIRNVFPRHNGRSMKRLDKRQLHSTFCEGKTDLNRAGLFNYTTKHVCCHR